MAIYSQAQLTTVTTITAPSWDIKAAAANSPRVMELFLNLGAATQSAYGIGRPGNDGSVAQTSGLALLPENLGDPAGQTTTAIAWGTAPTVPTTFLRRATLPGTVGAGVIYTFPRGLVLAVTKGICLWNITANSASTNVHVVCDE